MVEPSLCIICGDSRDVKKHYGVNSCFGCKAFFRRSMNDKRNYKCKKFGKCVIDKVSRNKCRACRFAKCKKNFKQDCLRDTRKQDHEDESVTSPGTSSNSNHPLSAPCEETRLLRSLNFMDFLLAMNKMNTDRYDPRYEHVTYQDIIELYDTYGRHISLQDGLQHPELVCPRTKHRYTCERIFTKYDMVFYWYRTFVMCADFANLLPQFRELPIEDQCNLFKLNFGTFSWCINMEFIVKDDMTEGYPMGNGSYAPWSDNDVESFLQDYNTPDMIYKPKKEAMITYKDFIHLNMILPTRNLDLDQKEFCILKTMLLFQQEEHLSDRGREVCHKTNNLLIDTLWDYQTSRYPELSFDERLRRHSRFLVLLSKIGQAWHFECDVHLLMAMFGDINLKGIPTELLFSNRKL